MEIVNNFNYLGTVLSCGGSFAHVTDNLAGKALRAMGSLFYVTKNMEVPVYIMLNLFDAFVAPILNYKYETWGFRRAENIGRIHRKFCKKLINVKISTNS